MAQETFQLAHGAAAIYEQQKVKAIFRPLADATLAAVEVSKDDVILDIACGTGIVARLIRERISPNASITGIDLNPGMIEMARSLTQDESGAFSWHVGDVTGMPFAAGSFTVAICQQGLQFFPDPTAALAEIRRVMCTGGRLILTIWFGISPFFRALADAIGRHVSPEDAARSLAPFTYSGLGAVSTLLKSNGFVEVHESQLTVDRVIQNPAQAIPREILSSPVGPAVAARGDKVMSEIVGDVLAACTDLRRGVDLVAPQSARLFVATVG